ncbi:MAG: ribonuclease HII [Cyclobacteriaceae bacterium]
MLLSHFSEYALEAGVDEVGRGCLAGPVVAAAVILPKDYIHSTLTDSKKVPEKKRDLLAEEIKRDAIAWAIAEVDHKKIDEINILNASFLAMESAIRQLKEKPQFLLIDGNRFKTTLDIPYECVVKGDSKFLSIAAASILAKTYRDNLMKEWHEKYPIYRWDKNKGYPTKDHRTGIEKEGTSPIHRLSFQLLSKQMELFF